MVEDGGGMHLLGGVRGQRARRLSVLCCVYVCLMMGREGRVVTHPGLS